MKDVKAKALYLKAKAPQNLKNNKRQTRKGVNKKGYTKEIQELWQTQRMWIKDEQENKVLNEKDGTQKKPREKH